MIWARGAIGDLRGWLARASALLGSAFAAIRIIRSQLLVAIVACLIFILPDQIHELYLVLAQDLASSFPSPAAILSIGRFYVSLMLIGYVLWHSARRQIAIREEFIARSSVEPSATLLRVLCTLLCSLPLFGAAIGLASARASIPGATVTPDAPEVVALNTAYWILIAVSLLIGLVQSGLLRLAAKSDRGSVFPARGHHALIVTVLLAILGSALPGMAQLLGPIVLITLFLVVLTYLLSAFTLAFDNYNFPVITALALCAIIFSWLGLNDNHRFRTEVDLAPEQRRDEAYRRTTFQNAFASWLSERKDIDAFPDGYPVYVVAAEGGGLYAAYHAAILLARIQDACPGFAQHVFAISSVSGGSLGAAVFAATAKKLAENREYQPCRVTDPNGGRFTRIADKTLARDFLSPLLWGALFPDFVQRFLPFKVQSFDRARSLERGFETAWRDTAAPAPGANEFADAFSRLWSAKGAAPALIINTTRADFGSRQLIAPFEISSLALLSSNVSLGREIDLPLSTAVTLSARFPWITPAGWIRLTEEQEIGQPRVHLVDGGYFENSGIETAFDIIGQLQKLQKPGRTKAPFRVYLLVIRAHIHRTSSAALSGELLTPIRVLYRARTERGILAAWRAYLGLCSDCKLNQTTPKDGMIVHALDLSRYPTALGWMLSDASHQHMRAGIGDPAKCDPADTQTVSEVNSCTVAAIQHHLNKSAD